MDVLDEKWGKSQLETIDKQKEVIVKMTIELQLFDFQLAQILFSISLSL